MSTTMMITPPAATEHDPYYGKYIALVPEKDILVALESQLIDALAVLRSIPEAKAGHRYAAGKWSIREVVGHLIDAERVFAYRALRFGRNDSTDLPGFDENTYVPAGAFDGRTLEDLTSELEHVRRANIAMFRGFPSEAWNRGGKANAAPITVRALAYIIVGHGYHHLKLVRERYLT